jgi:hypothetical protein
MSLTIWAYCECGCGEMTLPARKTSTRNGTIKGVPLRFVHGHNRRKSGVEYLIHPETDCWIWQRGRQARGYGTTTVDGRQVYAHRMMWERLRGPIPEGMEIDHLCRNHSCVNPDHLEPVTHRTNMQRGFPGPKKRVRP